MVMASPSLELPPPARVLDARLALSVRRATRSRRRADYLEALRTHAARLAGVPLPVDAAEGVDAAQALRDARREELALNGVRFAGAHRAEAFVAAVKRIAAAHAAGDAARFLRVTDRVLRACSRTLSGADSFFALHELFADPQVLVRGWLNRLRCGCSRLTTWVCGRTTGRLDGCATRRSSRGRARPCRWTSRSASTAPVSLS